MPVDVAPDDVFELNLEGRHRAGVRMRLFYVASLLIAFFVLIALLLNIVNEAFGLVALEYEVRPDTIADQPYDELNNDQLSQVLLRDLPERLLVIIRDNRSAVPDTEFTSTPLSEAVQGDVPSEYADRTISDLSDEERADLIAQTFSEGELREVVDELILQPEAVQGWQLFNSLTNREEIERIVNEEYDDAVLTWYSWLDLDFLNAQLSRNPALTGIRPAIIGTVWLMIIVIAVSFPLGVGAAIYLEEYAKKNTLNSIIELNIRNLAGVPSIIYGMLGLAIFARALEAITSGRTILSAGLTLALLILPIIIISAQEAIRAVPSELRQASYGLGATKWQTVWRQILPSALPGILTGTILAISRAVGETAPLIVVGAATYLSFDPTGPLSRFTALPILVYNWTTQPDTRFQHSAAAAIIVLLTILLIMNSTAIILRNRAGRF